jgi:hypothetical protein
METSIVETPIFKRRDGNHQRAGREHRQRMKMGSIGDALI